MTRTMICPADLSFSGATPALAESRARAPRWASRAAVTVLLALGCNNNNSGSGAAGGDDGGDSKSDKDGTDESTTTGPGGSSTIDTGFEDEGSGEKDDQGDDGDDGDDDVESGEGMLPKFDLTVPDQIPPNDGGDPRTCAEAKKNRTYVGCEFWPTITYNPVLTNFSFAAIVANGNETAAEVVVERGGNEVERVTVEPGSLSKIILPWVNDLKGPMFAANTTGARPKTSDRSNGGAYKLESDLPVSVWQFNPLEYKDDPDNCALDQNLGLPPDQGRYCYSVSNDAALLIPQSAMTKSYRVFIKDSAKGTDGGYADTPSSFTITATRDNTTVRVKLPEGKSTEGGGVPAIAAGGEATFEMNEGDVVQLLGTHGKWDSEPNVDLSGTLVTATEGGPIQVIASVALTAVPSPQLGLTGFADHLEELMLPTEVLGKHYIVTPNTSSQGENIGHYVRIYGNFPNTQLEYPGGKPAGAPDTIQAGEVYDIDTNDSFEVKGSESFAVGMFVRGGQIHTPAQLPTSGDPAFSIAVGVEQYRSRYIFLAPNDYDIAYADIIMPKGADLRLDGAALTATPEPIGDGDWVLVREKLGPGNDGAHLLEAADPEDPDRPRFGLQVMGYGHATGYMYPGGLNLDLISDPPPG